MIASLDSPVDGTLSRSLGLHHRGASAKTSIQQTPQDQAESRDAEHGTSGTDTIQGLGHDGDRVRIGFPIVEGRSHKEIAASRETVEGTVRQQAHAVYRKSKLSGKADFTAHFIKKMMIQDCAVQANKSSAHQQQYS